MGVDQREERGYGAFLKEVGHLLKKMGVDRRRKWV